MCIVLSVDYGLLNECSLNLVLCVCQAKRVFLFKLFITKNVPQTSIELITKKDELLAE